MTHRSIEQRLAIAKENQSTYRPNSEVSRHLSEVVLGSLVAVTSLGKSHIIPFVVEQGGTDFSEVGNISTRQKRPSDPENFRGGEPVESLLDRIEAGDMVNYLIHPTGNIYGTDTDSYKTKYVLLPTLTTAVEQFDSMGCFERVVPIGLMATGPTWEARLDERVDEARMREALTCIAWLHKRIQTMPVLENAQGDEIEVAQTIVDILQDPSHPRTLGNTERADLLLPQMAAVARNQLLRLEKL